jgi:hypothetical protein
MEKNTLLAKGWPSTETTMKDQLTMLQNRTIQYMNNLSDDAKGSKTPPNHCWRSFIWLCSIAHNVNKNKISTIAQHKVQIHLVNRTTNETYLLIYIWVPPTVYSLGTKTLFHYQF